MGELCLNYTATGSFPFVGAGAPQQAVNYIFNEFKGIPFWPQLPKYREEEKMINQFAQNILTENNSDEILDDYNKIVNENRFELLDKYGLYPPYSNAFELFIKKLKSTPSLYVKGQITGPCSLLFELNFNQNDKIKDTVTKMLSLKALWQIREIKKVNQGKIIIFIDEPLLNIVCDEKSYHLINFITNDIKKFGAIPAIHCCAEANWGLVFKTGASIINFDAYFYSKSVAKYSKEADNFIKNGGRFAFGIVPTLNKEALETSTVETLEKKFFEILEMFSKHGLDKNKILKECLITPACGLGSLDVKNAYRAMELTKKLAERISE